MFVFLNKKMSIMACHMYVYSNYQELCNKKNFHRNIVINCKYVNENKMLSNQANPTHCSSASYFQIVTVDTGKCSLSVKCHRLNQPVCPVQFFRNDFHEVD